MHHTQQSHLSPLTRLAKAALLTTGLFCTAVNAAAPVAVERITQASLQSQFTVHGTLYGKQDVRLTAGVNGLLTYVAEPGSLVHKGDILAKIDTLPLEFQHATQREMLTRAKINLRFHKQELSRLKKLAQSSSAAASQVDQIQNKHDLAQSDIALAEIALQRIADQINRATLTAPFSGVVSERFIQSGADVNRADKLIKLIDINNLEARIYIPIKYLNYIQQGQSLPITTTDSTPSQPTNYAKITAIIPATDPRSQSFEIRATLEKDTDSHWAVGQLVNISVPLKTDNTSWLVNRDALILRKDGVHIVKIDDQNTAQKVPVQVGKGKGKLVAITPLSAGSLSVNDTVVVLGAERLQAGQEVEVQQRAKNSS
ncbi:efflux RND transporter periplasmic adaptor subunit [Pseudoalteromonas citrea]|uniref:Efflux RND transporter periplasmic adaptor subunit n=2 Tax=Pseudoalteromonas citrea TaxID=43655 RepID=A0A5S3XJK9_9GAMM|nr:efflux RND transporter periplasmic adaptor subunit [Pseudoalteromonas citrea]TMP54667.1 efflux RND transporter periplasmic adaptor subunit [Pseudoalteromonas citrea]